MTTNETTNLSAEQAVKVIIIQTRSAIRCNEKQRATLRGLGLKRIGSQVTRVLDGSIVGMIKVVEHLIQIMPA